MRWWCTSRTDAIRLEREVNSLLMAASDKLRCLLGAFAGWHVGWRTYVGEPLENKPRQGATRLFLVFHVEPEADLPMER